MARELGNMWKKNLSLVQHLFECMFILKACFVMRFLNV